MVVPLASTCCRACTSTPEYGAPVTTSFAGGPPGPRQPPRPKPHGPCGGCAIRLATAANPAIRILTIGISPYSQFRIGLKWFRNNLPATPTSAAYGSRCRVGIDGQCHGSHISVRIGTAARAREVHDRRAAVLRSEDSVLALQGSVYPEALRVGLGPRHLLGDVFGEEELARVGHVAARIPVARDRASQAHLQMNVDRPARIPAWIECRE